MSKVIRPVSQTRGLNPMNDAARVTRKKLPHRQSHLSDNLSAIKAICSMLVKKPGEHSVIVLTSAGFQYTGNGDTTRCDQCGLEVSDWTANMSPMAVHSQRSPDCPFVCSMRSLPSTHGASISDRREDSAQHDKTGVATRVSLTANLLETGQLQEARKRSFSHWLQGAGPSSAQLMEAGFFNCNVGDRVICIYCNLICQQWLPEVDDPCEVHRTLSPRCTYVLSKLMRREGESVAIVNDNSIESNAADASTDSNSGDAFRCGAFVHMKPCHPAYSGIPSRHASFATCPTEKIPPVDDLVRAGFFYTGTETIVTCFYCNGSLQNWGTNDNPTIEHARWFPNCPYAKQLCGDDLHRKVQESKRLQQRKSIDLLTQIGLFLL